MPTGYTADIAKDISFEDFVWGWNVLMLGKIQKRLGNQKEEGF